MAVSAAIIKLRNPDNNQNRPPRRPEYTPSRDLQKKSVPGNIEFGKSGAWEFVL